jgi:predicted aldo/keto reductase-like oxidoreductase
MPSFYTMKNNKDSISRRDFLAATGAIGVGAILASSRIWGADVPRQAIARRKFGKTGVEVPIIGLGCMFDIINNQVILRQAFDRGVTYWDTAAGYGKGGSERGIGMFLERNPSARKELFLVTKGRGPDYRQTLDESLARLKVDYVDLFLSHAVGDIGEVDTPEARAFAERAKRDGKIKFFGFSTHSNVAQCLEGAAKLGWIDGILMTYNYRTMHEPDVMAAIDACGTAGIGLTAMKTQGQWQWRETPEQAAILAPLLARGFTPGQAKLKAVMENPQISTACVQMPSLKLCHENIAAALDATSLAESDRAALEQHAAATATGYCAGCSRLCEPTIGNAVPVADIMRDLMYHRHYGDSVDARSLLAELPVEVRARLPLVDYAAAERACPRGLPIGLLMREASVILG